MDACRLEIYQNSLQYGRYYCRVTAGESGFVGIATFVFKPVKDLYDIPLNGPGRSKAEKKVKRRLKEDGLDLRILREHPDILILPKD